MSITPLGQLFEVEIENTAKLGGWRGIGPIRRGTGYTQLYSSHSELPIYVPGKRRIEPIQLKRIMDDSDVLEEWAGKGVSDKRGGSIIYLDHDGKERKRLNWSHGWVCEHIQDPLDAGYSDNELRFETIVLVVADLFKGSGGK